MTGTSALRPRQKWLVTAFLLILLACIAVFVFVRNNPIWFIERATDVYLWKSHVHHREIVVAGNRIHYLETAPAHEGSQDKPIVLIHGLGARASDWTVMIPALAHAGYHVYAIDLLGYGRSAQPRGGDYSLTGEENVVLGFVDALHLSQADVAGWSMGGWIAMKFALDHPTRVRRLLLYDSAGLYMPVDFPLRMFNPATPADLDTLLNRIEPNHRIIHIPAFAIPGLLRQKQRTAWIIDASLASMLNGSQIVDFRVHALHMPVLLVWGTEDKLTTLDSGLHLHDLVSQSVLVELEGCGHLAAAECAHQAIPPTLQFLNAEPPPPPSIMVVPHPK